MRIYGDIVCGALNLVLRDIPEIYSEVVSNPDLSSLNLTSWVIVLLYVSQELDKVTTLSGNQPPKIGIEHVASEAVNRLYNDIINVQRDTIHPKEDD